MTKFGKILQEMPRGMIEEIIKIEGTTRQNVSKLAKKWIRTIRRAKKMSQVFEEITGKKYKYTEFLEQKKDRIF